MSKKKTLHPKVYSTKLYIGEREVTTMMSTVPGAIMVADPKRIWSTGEQIITREISKSISVFNDI